MLTYKPMIERMTRAVEPDGEGLGKDVGNEGRQGGGLIMMRSLGRGRAMEAGGRDDVDCEIPRRAADLSASFIRCVKESRRQGSNHGRRL
jgi:hypothetical protein